MVFIIAHINHGNILMLLLFLIAAAAGYALGRAYQWAVNGAPDGRRACQQHRLQTGRKPTTSTDSRRGSQPGKAEEKAGSLTPQAEAELKALRQKAHSLETNKRQRDKCVASLVVKCQLRSRSAGRSGTEEKARLEVCWRLWDQALQAAADPAGSQLAVAAPTSSLRTGHRQP